MSKERLEEIEKRVSNMPTGMPTQVITWQGWKTVKILLEDDYKYLREQAERVQELEDENEQLKDDVNRMENEYIHGVKELNKRYREALEQIAHGDTWTAYPHDIAKWALECELARQALEDETNER